MSDHEDETITVENAPPKNIPQITTVTNISARSSAKSMTTDKDGNMKIHPPITAEEQQQARFGRNAESKKMQKFDAAVVSPHFETEFAFMGLSTEVSIPVTCPLCCDSKYKLIEKDYQGQREQLNDCVVDLKAHKHAVKIIEKQIKCHQKNQLAYEEKIRVLSYELKEKSNILEYRQKLIDQVTQEKQELMTKLNNEIANQAKWNNSGKNLYKLIDSSMSVRTKRGLGLDKYIGEGKLGINDSKFSIFHTNTNYLEGQPIYNRFASVDHMKAVPPPLTGNYMPPFNIPDIDESQMVYGKKANDSSEIKSNDDSTSHSNDSVLFDFSDRSSEPSTNDFQKCDSSVEGSQPNQSDHDTTDSISSVSTPASKSRYTIVIDCDKQEDFPSVCSINTDVKSSNTLCNKFGSFNKGSHFRKHKSCYVCGSYFHLIKDCDLHEQRVVKRHAKGKGILRRRPKGKIVNPNKQKPVSAGKPKPVSAGKPKPVSTGKPNPVSAGHGLNGKTVVKPSAGWPWTKYGMSKTKGSKINGGSRSKSWSYAKAALIKGRLMPEGRLMPKDSTKSSRGDSKMFMVLQILHPNVAVDTFCYSTLNPHTALMTIYYWKLDNKQVIIHFRGGLLGIVIPAARAFYFCCQVFISAGDLFLLKSIEGNNAKSMTTDKDGNLKIHPPITVEEYQQVQREEEARTILLSALPNEHMGGFYHMIDARDIWNSIKA
nr:xylulose kinase-1 [Tanacetum cinerariifolium]